MLLARVLLLIGIASSKFSARLGMPVLVLFLAVGMLAGSEGIGRIPFENYPLANSVGSAALALILFDGGLRTTLECVRRVWRQALALSTVGVLLTAVIIVGQRPGSSACRRCRGCCWAASWAPTIRWRSSARSA